MPPDPKDVTLAVLAGGEGSRMGGPKAWLELRGQLILHFLSDRFAWPGPTQLVTTPGLEHPPGCERFSREVVDPVRGLGPLRGVLTALEHCRTRLLVVTTVDMPLVGPEQIRWLAGELDARPHLQGVLPSPLVAGKPRVEPFPCALDGTAAAAIADHLAAGRRSVRGLLNGAAFAAVPAPHDCPMQVWTNLNSPSDYLAFLEGPQ